MTSNEDRQYPPALAAAMAVRLDSMGEDGADFEPCPAFLSADETTEWLRQWTRNGELNGDEFRVFGQDGTGGCAAFWLVRPGRALAGQPVVFLGSEGETGVVASDLGDFLWLLAAGLGPWEAVDSREPDWIPRAHPDLTAIAEQFAPDHRASATAVMERAAREFPDFDDIIMRLCR
ncbi:SMI1/KNR4 family protein [Streptomyces sp. NPDC088725]|uniref:SMI1/KNR4 family protein n=1 Tax=Streptomyces sp. NPDC088725 TaxID=3365873 RepID=UPI0037F37D7D